MNTPEFLKLDFPAPGVPTTNASASSKTAIGDFNGDGYMDVAFTQADWPSGTILNSLNIWLGQEDGTFVLGSDIIQGDPVLTQFTGFILTADFNDDGVDDLYLATYGNERDRIPEPDVVLLSQADGTLARSTSEALERLQWSHGSSIGDADGDGDIDILQSGMTGLDDPTKALAHLLLNDGNGNFVDATASLPDTLSAEIGTQIYASDIADLNGDGYSDIVIGHAGGHNIIEVDGNIQYLPTGHPGTVYYGQADGSWEEVDLPLGTFASYNTDTVDIQHADVDGDGDLDLVLSNYNSGWVLDSNGNFTRVEDGNFEENPPVEGAYQWRDIQLLINNGDGSFSDKSNQIQTSLNGLGVARYLSDLITIDLNGDGFVDLLGNPSTSLDDSRSGIYAWLNDGTGNFSAFDIRTVLIERGVDYAYNLTAQDMDRDGDQDLVFQRWAPIPDSDQYGPSFGVLYNDHAPALDQPMEDRSSDEDTAFEFALPTGMFTDLDGDTLSYAATLANGDTLPSWIDFDASTGSFTGTPPANFNGTLSITVTASDDSRSASDTFILTISPADDAPTAIILAAATIAENAAAGTVVGTLSATDPDTGDTTSFTLVDNAGLFAISNGQVVLAQGARLDFETAQSYEITVRATDSQGLTYDQVLEIDVSNVTETITGSQNIRKPDYLQGFGYEDILRGLGGNDTLDGGGGADRLDGGAGVDTASYASASAGIKANLAKAGVNVGDAEGDTYVSIENLLGSDFGDILVGNKKNNRLDGGLGDDELAGGAGADIFVFGEGYGTDTITDFAFKGKAQDAIDLSDADGIGNFKDLMKKHIDEKQGDVFITADDGATLIIEDTRIKSLDKGDFLF